MSEKAETASNKEEDTLREKIRKYKRCALAAAIMFMLEQPERDEVINVSDGSSVTGQRLAEVIMSGHKATYTLACYLLDDWSSPIEGFSEEMVCSLLQIKKEACLRSVKAMEEMASRINYIYDIKEYLRRN